MKASKSERLAMKLVKIAEKLDLDACELKVLRETDAVVRITFSNSKHKSIEAALSPDNYEIINIGH